MTDEVPAAHRDPPEPLLDPDALPEWTLRPIGVVESPFRYVHDAPRQPGERPRQPGEQPRRPGEQPRQPGEQPHQPGENGAPARIVLRSGLQNCVADLRGFDRIWVIFVFSFARGWGEMVRPPRDSRKRGVLATRSPHRPNPIGISCVRLRDVRGTVIDIVGHDLLHGTPVLDIKPYVPYADAFPDASAGWVDRLAADAPDHRWE